MALRELCRGALRRLLPQQCLEEVLALGAHLPEAPTLLQVNLVIAGILQDDQDRRRLKGSLARQEEVQQDASSEAVDLVGVDLRADHLGGHVAGRAAPPRHLELVRREAGDAEVRQDRPPIAAQEHVVRLDVAVHHPAGVHVRERGEQAGHDLPGARLREQAPAHGRAEAAPAAVLQEHDGAPRPRLRLVLRAEGPAEAHDVRVGELREHRHLLLHVLGDAPLPRAPAFRGVQCHLGNKLGAVTLRPLLPEHAEDHCHGALPQGLLLQLVAAIEVAAHGAALGHELQDTQREGLVSVDEDQPRAQRDLGGRQRDARQPGDVVAAEQHLCQQQPDRALDTRALRAQDKPVLS
mmetsp:Transcript_91967/g.268975  ORF Transcript_91967/g.268975 Transcript_91967/m.268975 type:complete len:351 (-) Transcript_91967:191-1243(-)